MDQAEALAAAYPLMIDDHLHAVISRPHFSILGERGAGSLVAMKWEQEKGQNERCHWKILT